MNVMNYDKYIRYLFAKADKNATPLSGCFELTTRCSLSCKMCYIHRGENSPEAKSAEKPAEWWLSLAKEARDAGMLLLLLSGGEPLLREDFKEIYLGCRALGLLVSVNTNATLINKEWVRFFKENPPAKLNISIYGASAETYESLCGNGGAFERVKNAVTDLVNAGVNVKINYNITPQNKDDAEKILGFCKELKLPVQIGSYMMPPMRVCGEAVRLEPREAARAHFNCQKYRLKENFKAHIENLTNKAEGASEITLDNLDEPCGEGMKCRAGSTIFWITWDGKLSACGMIPEPSASLENGFDAAWDEVRKRCENIKLPAECTNCDKREYCDVCAAIACTETGRFDGVPRYACQKAEEYRNLCKSYLNSF